LDETGDYNIYDFWIYEVRFVIPEFQMIDLNPTNAIAIRKSHIVLN